MRTARELRWRGDESDDDDEVNASVRRCICLLGEACPPPVYVPLLLTQLHASDPDASSDTGVIAKRGLILATLESLMSGASPDALRPQLPALAAAIATPHFCVQPAGIDDDRAATYTATQLRLCGFLRALIERAGGDCAASPQGFHLYAALMRLAAIPSTAGRGFTSQKAALETVALLAAAHGLDGISTGPLHARYMPGLVGELLGDGAADGPKAPYWAWQAHTPEWHLLQALLRHGDGATAASQLLHVVPCLTRLLDPKQEPVLRGTALAMLDALLATPSFAAAPELDEWAELIFAAMLVPNLVWRAGRAAEHVRQAAMLCLTKLVPLPSLTPSQLEAQLGEAMPLFHTALDDDNVDTRRASCAVVAASLDKLGASRLDHDRARKLYPELLKRLDDASDDVRMRACAPLRALFSAMSYSAIWNEHVNFDKANYQYLLRGLLVHLDDPSPEIQQCLYALLEGGMAVDPIVFAEEVSAVRERHRSPKLCDQLVEAARGLGQLV